LKLLQQGVPDSDDDDKDEHQWHYEAEDYLDEVENDSLDKGSNFHHLGAGFIFTPKIGSKQTGRIRLRNSHTRGHDSASTSRADDATGI
jgi:hypothetical protein